jgi:hypothetical protein
MNVQINHEILIIEKRVLYLKYLSFSLLIIDSSTYTIFQILNFVISSFDSLILYILAEVKLYKLDFNFLHDSLFHFLRNL